MNSYFIENIVVETLQNTNNKTLFYVSKHIISYTYKTLNCIYNVDNRIKREIVNVIFQQYN